jgi:ABC-type multidrug transport system fused ATPase/permease subunit
MDVTVAISFILAIPVMFLIYTITHIRKERIKRERNFIYCKSDIMENETLRDYLISDEYKFFILNLTIVISIIILITFVIGIIAFYMSIIALSNVSGASSPTYISPSILLVCILIVPILSYTLFSVRSITETDEMKKYKDTRDDLVATLETIIPQSSIKSFKDFDSGFLKPFIERAKKRINDIDNDYFIDKIFNKDKIREFTGLLRPSLNYFITEDNKIVQDYDTDFIYKLIKTKNKKQLPELKEEIKYHDLSTIEFCAWIILILLFYITFNKIYLMADDIAVQSTVVCIISIICIMVMYYILIAKNRL